MLKLIIRLGYFATVFIEALIIAKVVLSVVDTNSENPLVSWITNTSSLFIQPFEGIVTNSLQINNTTLSLTPLVALVCYVIIGFVLSELLKSFSRE